MAICEENTKDIPTIALQQPKRLTLIDAIGNYREIPFDFGVCYELFTDVLRAYYKHQELPGHAFVARGDYQIILGDNYRVVEASEWSTMIRPDSTVEMSMILRRRGDTTVKCPRYGAAPKDTRVDGWADCSRCPGRFRTTVKEEDEEELVSPPTSTVVDPSNEPDSSHQGTQGSASESRALEVRHDKTDLVWKRFRLLSIVSLVKCISNPAGKSEQTMRKRCWNCGQVNEYEDDEYGEPLRPGERGPEAHCESCGIELDDLDSEDNDTESPELTDEEELQEPPPDSPSSFDDIAANTGNGYRLPSIAELRLDLSLEEYETHAALGSLSTAPISGSSSANMTPADYQPSHSGVQHPWESQNTSPNESVTPIFVNQTTTMPTHWPRRPLISPTTRLPQSHGAVLILLASQIPKIIQINIDLGLRPQLQLPLLWIALLPGTSLNNNSNTPIHVPRTLPTGPLLIL